MAIHVTEPTLRQKLKLRRRKPTPVQLADGDGTLTVYVRALPYARVCQLRDADAARLDVELLPKLVASVLVDEHGQRVYPPDDEYTVAELADWDTGELNKVLDAALKLSKVDVDEAGKGSTPTRS